MTKKQSKEINDALDEFERMIELYNMLYWETGEAKDIEEDQKPKDESNHFFQLHPP